MTGKCIGQESSECIEYYEKVRNPRLQDNNNYYTRIDAKQIKFDKHVFLQRKLKSSRDKQLRRAEVSKLE